MRSLFLILLLLNLLFLALQLDLLGVSIHESRQPERLEQQLNAERLRLVRDAPPRTRPVAPAASVRPPE